MKIIVNGAVRVDEVDDMHRLVVSSGLSQAEVGARLEAAALGYSDATHAWIDADALRLQAEPLSQDAQWSVAYQKMLGYARSKGWWDETSNSIRAHITAP